MEVIKGRKDFSIRGRLAPSRKTGQKDTGQWHKITCPECGNSYWTRSYNNRRCDYCTAHPNEQIGIDKDAHKMGKWILIKDNSPEDCKFKEGVARFTLEEIELMEQMGTIAPGSKFRHIREKTVRIDG